ncbi:MAG: YbaK/EbsC family protein [Anaerolineales bacterium]|nr:YbaK/EbsC family protein [Anaerolineales bacterium]
MPATKFYEYLEGQGIRYTLIKHDGAIYTAQEIAAATHIPGDQLAKTVMVKIDGELAMAVLPAPYRVNLERLKALAGGERIELASEREFKQKFPDCEAGAMPPFGNLYGVPVYADRNLAEEIEIAFCGGAHGELVRMSFEDFNRLVKPQVLGFAWKP